MDVQNVPPEPRSVQPVQPVSPPVPPPPPQPLGQSQSRRKFFLFGLVIVILFIIGFGGAWAYSRFFKSKQIPAFDRRKSDTVTFSAIAPGANSEEQAISAIKNAYPELKDIEKMNDRGTPKTFIRSLQTKTGWKVRFNRGYGECGEKYDGCQREQYYYFTVALDGKVAKVGEAEMHHSVSGQGEVQRTGTSLPNFLDKE